MNSPTQPDPLDDHAPLTRVLGFVPLTREQTNQLRAIRYPHLFALLVRGATADTDPTPDNRSTQ